jgi:hypothetical protein
MPTPNWNSGLTTRRPLASEPTEAGDGQPGTWSVSPPSWTASRIRKGVPMTRSAETPPPAPDSTPCHPR